MNITIDIEPTPKGVPRTKYVQGHVITYYHWKTTEAMENMRTLIMQNHVEPFPAHVPLKLTCTFFRRKSPWLPKRETMPFRKPDLDNFCKLTIDTISHILIPDDAQITSLIAKKRWSPNGEGYIEIAIEEDTP